MAAILHRSQCVNYQNVFFPKAVPFVVKTVPFSTSINWLLTSGGGNIIRQTIPTTNTPKLKATTAPRRKANEQSIISPRPSSVESNSPEENKITMTSHQMEIFSALLAFCAGNSPVTGEFPAQRPMTRSFDVFYLHLNKQLSKQSWGWWFETTSRTLWRHCDVMASQIIGNLIVRSTAGSVTTKKTSMFRIKFPCYDIITYNDVRMRAMASQITSLTIVYSTVYSGADQRKHQSSALLAFLRGIHRWPVNPRTKGQWHGECFHLVTSSWYPWYGVFLMNEGRVFLIYLLGSP